MGTRKILTITMEIEVNEKVTRHSRIRDTYSEVVEAAIEAARIHMPSDSIEQVTCRARWEYRHWDPEPVTISKDEIDEGADIEGIEEITDDDFEWEDEK